MRVATLAVAVSVLIGSATIAQGQADNCDALLQYGIFNRVASLRSVSSAESFHSDVCSQTASSMSDSRVTEIGASYGLFSGSASDARKRIEAYQSRYCSNTDQSSSGANLSQDERSYVSPELVSAFSSCKALSARGVSIEPTLNFSRYATFSIRQTIGGIINLQGVWAVPHTAWTCQGQNPNGQVVNVDHGTSLPLGASLLTITCERVGNEVVIGGARILEAPASTLEIHTQVSNLILPFAQTSAQNELNSLKESLARAIPSGLIAAFATACPIGWQDFAPASGRVLLGQSGAHPVGQRDGQETATLTVANLPPHQHQTVEAGDPVNSIFGTGATQRARNGVSWVPNYGTSSMTAMTGSAQALSTMPPYYAVRYCQKQ